MDHIPCAAVVLMMPVRWCARNEAIRLLRLSGEEAHISATAGLGRLMESAYIAASAITLGWSAARDQSA
jgi:hypothetical protein